MRTLRSIAFVASSLLALLTGGCAGHVVDPGGTGASGSTGSGSTGSGSTGSGASTPVASPLYGVSPTYVNVGGALTVSRIDEDTGLATPIAQIDSVSSWSQSLFVDVTATHAYTIVFNGQKVLVCTTDLVTGTVTKVPFSSSGNLVATPRPVGVTQEGLVVAVGQAGTTDFNASILLIDPTSGAFTVFDQISLVLDSEASFGSMIYDAPSRVLYIVYGEGGSSSWRLARYSFDTKKFEVSPSISSVPPGVVLAGVLPDGKVAGVYRDNPQTAFVSTAEIDPVTGGVTVVQHVSGPSTWPNDATVHEGKVWFDTGDVDMLYGLDPGTGTGTQVALSDMFTLAHY